MFQGLHRYWPPITRLVAELELELGHPCQANAYLTPPGSQGFAVHSDSHDVFVFQTAGAKQWEVHTPDGVEDLTLEPGLSVYLPTGTPHAARAQDTVSLHVTLGINQLTWRGLTRRSVATLLDEVPDDHLPAGYLDDPGVLAAGLADRLASLADRMRGLDARAAVDDEVRRFLTGRTPRLAGGLLDRTRLAALDDTTPLRRRPGHPCVLLPRGDRLEVLLGDRSVDVPARLEPALVEIRRRPQLRPADLAEHLDEQSRLVLFRRLVREGLLESGSEPARSRRRVPVLRREPAARRADRGHGVRGQGVPARRVHRRLGRRTHSGTRGCPTGSATTCSSPRMPRGSGCC